MHSFEAEAGRVPTREAKILSGLNKAGLGLEIGGSINPLLRPGTGVDFKTLDHLSRDDLISKYKSNPDVDLTAISHVDYVWSGEPFSQLVGAQKFDWIVASHVIEHVPDVVGFLINCQSILTDNGVLSLVVPDKRYQFDCFRPTTGLAWILDAHLRQEIRPSPGAVIEFGLYGARRDGQHVWGKSEVGGAYEFIGFFEGAYDLMMSIDRGEYRDCHVTAYTPSQLSSDNGKLVRSRLDKT